MEDFKNLSEMKELLEELMYIPVQISAWKDIDDSSAKYNNINIKDKVVYQIEIICNLIIEELKRQNLTDINNNFLENHTNSIMSRIKDSEIRSMHIMQG